jgi:hypothetical protein
MITRNAKRVCREDGGIAAIKNSFAAAWLWFRHGLNISSNCYQL